MALFAGPFDTANMAQANWEEVESKLWSSGVINGARNSFAVTLTSGLGVSVNTGDAIVDGFRFSNDAATALTATAADPTNPRIDRVILRVDEAGHSGTIVIKAGTPAPSPTPPALTQTVGGTFEISLAQIRINAAGVTIASLTDERTYATAAIGPNAITSAQIASVLASAVAAGTLPAGVIEPAAQIGAGATPDTVAIGGTGPKKGAGFNLDGSNNFDGFASLRTVLIGGLGVTILSNAYFDGTNYRHYASGLAYQIINSSGLMNIRFSTDANGADGIITWSGLSQMVFAIFSTTQPASPGVSGALWINTGL